MRTRLQVALALGALPLSALSGPASAADLSAGGGVPSSVPGWTGLYVGGSAGYAWSGGLTDISTPPGYANPAFGSSSLGPPSVNVGVASNADLESHRAGFVGGAQLGYNRQFGRLVFGFETDEGIAASGSPSSVTNTIPGTLSSGSATVPSGVHALSDLPPRGYPGVVSTLSAARDASFLGTLRGRAGVLLMPGLLSYATGGLAYGHTCSQAGIAAASDLGYIPLTNATGATCGMRAGWTVGGGLEYKISASWSVKAEYLHYDLGRATYPLGALAYTYGTNRLFFYRPFATTRFTGDIARVGLNYAFATPATMFAPLLAARP